MSELPPGVEPAVAAASRPSASGILLRRAGDRWHVLVGLRARTSRFMPGHFAFPGGGLEPQDGAEDDDGFRRCVTREILEETGIPLAPGEWIAAGERTTPPIFPVRFRTLFFVAPLPDDAQLPAEPPTRENERFEIADAAQIVTAWSRGDARIPPPVLPLLRAIGDCRGAGIDEVVAAVARANAVEDRAPRIEFVPQLWMVPQRTATLPPATHTNVWISGGRRFVVVDPGSDDAGEIDRLLEVIERRRAIGGSPAAILLTHGHRDHAAGAIPVGRRLAVPVLAHETTLAALDLPQDLPRRSLVDGERLDLGGESLVVHFTPGHHAGHLAFHDPVRNALIAGDLVSGLSTVLIDPDSGDMRSFVESLARMHALNCTILLPGHGPPLPGKALERVRLHRLEREQRIVRSLGSGDVTLRDVARAAYAADDTPGVPIALAERQTLAHLLKLEREGRAAANEGRWELLDACARIREILERTLKPVSLAIADDSAKHVGHRGATSGGGHFRVEIVSDAFEGRSRVEQHRLVYDVLAQMFEAGEIHALGLETRANSER